MDSFVGGYCSYVSGGLWLGLDDLGLYLASQCSLIQSDGVVVFAQVPYSHIVFGAPSALEPEKPRQTTLIRDFATS